MEPNFALDCHIGSGKVLHPILQQCRVIEVLKMEFWYQVHIGAPR